jgi:oligoendopeptidase F
MTKAIKAQELFAANPGISNKDFVQMLMTQLGMSINGARTYSYNARNPKDVKGKVAKVAKVKQKSSKPKLEKSVRAINASFAKSVDDIAAIKEANLKRMQDVSSKLRPFRDRLDEVIMDRNPEFDPQEAREEVQAILDAEGYKDRPQMFED